MSVYFEWNESMSVDEPTIDAQHKRLLAQVNKVIEAMLFGIASKEVNEAISFFDTYINEHLAYEEEYMRRRGYLDLEKHKQKHQDFRKKYAEFNEKLKGGKTSSELLIEMEEFLGNWWLGHIGYEDKKYHDALGSVE